jgi:hypothetical protein
MLGGMRWGARLRGLVWRGALGAVLGLAVMAGPGVGRVWGASKAQAEADDRAAPLTLEEVLKKLRANYQEYMRDVPNLFCDERVLSEYGPYQTQLRPLHTVTDSVFRLQRVMGPDKRPDLKESRQVKLVDGRAATKDELTGPSILSGVFGEALGMVVEGQTCLRFELKPHGPHFGPRRIEVDFHALPAETRPEGCTDRKMKGHVLIDPETMRIRRIELLTTDYTIFPEMMGQWTWWAEYDPVVLGGKPFWLPSRIYSEAVSYGEKRSIWTFDASYGNYHKMVTSAHILPGFTVEPGEPTHP